MSTLQDEQASSGTGSGQQAQPSGKLSNPHEIQGTIALVTVGGFMCVAGAAAIADVIRGLDPISILNVLSPLAIAVVSFFFGSKAAAAAAASAPSTT
jgi:hypothetical protein